MMFKIAVVPSRSLIKKGNMENVIVFNTWYDEIHVILKCS